MNIAKYIFDEILNVFKKPEEESLLLPSEHSISMELKQLFSKEEIPKNKYAAVLEEIKSLPQHIQDQILTLDASGYFEKNRFIDWLNTKVDYEIKNFILSLKESKTQILKNEEGRLLFEQIRNQKTIPLSWTYIQFMIKSFETIPILLLFPDEDTISYFEDMGFSKEDISYFKNLDNIIDEIKIINKNKNVFICKHFCIRHYLAFVNQKSIKMLFNRFPFYVELHGKKYDMEFFIKFIENKEKIIEYNSKKRRNEFEIALYDFWEEVFKINKNSVNDFGHKNIFTFLKKINTTRHDNYLLPIYHKGIINRNHKSENQIFRTIYSLYHHLIPYRFVFKNEIEYKLNSSLVKAREDYNSFDEYVVRKIRNFLYKKD